MGASVVVGALCVSHSDLAKDKNRYVVKIILHLKRSLGRARESVCLLQAAPRQSIKQFDALPRFVLHFKLKKNSPIWVRIPCIKNVNDSDKEIEAYCRYLQHADNIQRIELIPYHSYGEHKYKMLGKSVQNFMPMDKQISQVLQKKLEAQGFQVINYC